MQKGKLIVFSGPSGVGKGTIRDIIFNNLSEFKNFEYSISATTRSARVGEENEVDYYFKTREEFEDMIEKNEFLEYAEFVGNYYGTPIKVIEEKINKGINVVLEIEAEGAKIVLNKVPDALSIFLLPPSIEELESRLKNRGTESDELIEKRIQKASYEIENMSDMYQFKVINNEINSCVKEVEEIILNNTNLSK